MEKKSTTENKLSLMSISLNFVLLVVLALVFNRLWSLEHQVNELSKRPPTVVQKETVPVPANASEVVAAIKREQKEKSVEIGVNDQGFSPSGFQMGKDDKMTVTITNQGQEAHSFVIEELGINSGAIDPGQAVKVNIDKEFTEAAAVEFISDIDGDDQEVFKGTIMVF